MLLCTDFDGTLRIPDDPTALDANLSALTEWRAAGNYACLITGRNYSVFPKILPAWKNYFDYLATDNGGAIYDRQGDLIITNPFSETQVKTILAIIPSTVLPVFYYPNFFTANPYPSLPPVKLRLWFRNLDELWSKHRYFESSVFYLKSLPWPKPGYSQLPGVDLSQYCGFIDLVPIDNGKEVAAQRVADLLSTPPSKVISAGDDYNDIALLKAFRGYAVHSSLSEVIQAASGRSVASIAELITYLLATS